jgi:hypothetical protein
MNRPLHILLILLLLATTAGRGMASAAMAGCTEMPAASHAGDGHAAAPAHADGGGDTSSAAMAHDLGLCCLACVAPPLPASLANLGAAPVRAAPLLGDPERYRSIVPDPMRRPPRSLA